MTVTEKYLRIKTNLKLQEFLTRLFIYLPDISKKMKVDTNKVKITGP